MSLKDNVQDLIKNFTRHVLNRQIFYLSWCQIVLFQWYLRHIIFTLILQNGYFCILGQNHLLFLPANLKKTRPCHRFGQITQVTHIHKCQDFALVFLAGTTQSSFFLFVWFNLRFFTHLTFLFSVVAPAYYFKGVAPTLRLFVVVLSISLKIHFIDFTVQRTVTFVFLRVITRIAIRPSLLLSFLAAGIIFIFLLRNFLSECILLYLLIHRAS